MTYQDVLNNMEVLNQELQLQTGEEDQARGMIAVNMGLKYFEALVSRYPKVLGDQTTTVTTTANTETTTFPTRFLRIDRIQYLDPTTSRPVFDLTPIKKTGGHSWPQFWPWNVLSVSSTGVPRAYYTNGRNIYWATLPSSSSHTMRVYGFQAQAQVSSSNVTDTFPYADEVTLPVAAFATQLLKIGVDDEPQNIKDLADQTFADVIRSLISTNRDGATPFEYTRYHEA